MFINMMKKGMKFGIVLYCCVFVMLGFGFIYGYFLYNGDILYMYVIFGLVVILFLFVYYCYVLMVFIGLLFLNFLLYVLLLFNE